MYKIATVVIGFKWVNNYFIVLEQLFYEITIALTLKLALSNDWLIEMSF